MCSVNHDLKVIYIHIPKNGGLYVEHILKKYYGFEYDYNIMLDNFGFVYEDELFYLPHYNRGVLKYYINSKIINDKLKLTKEMWNKYTKFTFVRNPYTKIISSYEYLKILYKNNHYKNENYESIQFPSFSEFIKNQKYGIEQSLYKNNIELYCYHYYHTFIKQYEHLLNNDNKINIDYIGNFENLNEELINILSKIGVKNPIKHFNEVNNNTKINETKKNDISQYIIDNDLLTFINEYYNNDFELFGYKKYSNINDLYINNNFEKQNEDFLEKNKFLIEKYKDNVDSIYNIIPIRNFLYRGSYV
jgi:hypothetical protein